MKSSQINHGNLCLITAELLVHVYIFCLFKIIIHCWLLYSMKWKNILFVIMYINLRFQFWFRSLMAMIIW